MSRLRIHSTALLALFALAACSDDPVQPGTLANNTGALGSDGRVEITISGIGSDHMSSVARYAPGAEAASGSNPAPAGVSRVSPMGGRLSTTNLPNGLEISSVSTSSFTSGERGNGGYRYVSATYKVRNAKRTDSTAYTHTQQNVTFVALNAVSGCSSGGTLDGTGICTLKKFDGTSAGAGLALQVLPTGAAMINPSTGALSSSPTDVLQVYEEADVSDVSGALPYGFVVRTSSSANRNLSASPGASQFDGLVTFAFRVPLQATKGDDPFTISALFTPVEDNQTVVTQSLEEADAASLSAVHDRALGLSGSILSLTGHVFSGVTSNGICSVRTAGTSGSPTAYLVNGLANEMIPSPFEGNAHHVAANASFSISACVVLQAATASNFVVHGAQSGWLHDAYSSASGFTVMTPPRSGGYFRGEELQVTLTSGILDEGNNPIFDPRVHQYWVATTAGTGSLGSAATLSTTGFPRQVTLGDLNGDGKLDLVTTDESGSSVYVRLGDGLGSFGTATPVQADAAATGTEEVKIIDMDHDGKNDLVILTRAPGVGEISVLLGNGNGTFGAPNQFFIPAGPAHMVAGDFNADGNVDIAVNAGDNSVTVMLGDGAGGLAYGSSFGATAGNLVVGDVNNDGKLDIVAAYADFNGFLAYLGDGAGNFTLHFSPAADAQMWIALGDVNGDGDLDVIYSNSSSSGVSVALGNGTGGFAETSGSPYSSVEFSNVVAVGDMNHDGKLDVVSVDGDSPSTIRVLTGNGTGVLTAGSGFGALGNLVVNAALGDVNNDGALDVVTADYNSSKVSVLLGNP